MDEKLSTYYPEVVDKTLTLRQLLSHSSGIDPFIPNRDDLDQAGLIAAINAIKVKDDKPFLYTDINFILLGLMLEKSLEQHWISYFSFDWTELFFQLFWYV